MLNLKDGVSLELDPRIIYVLEPVISLVFILFTLYGHEVDKAEMLDTHEDFGFEWEQNNIIDALGKLKMSISFAIRIVELYSTCGVDLVNHLHWWKVNRKKMSTKTAQVALTWFEVCERAEHTMAFGIKSLNQF